MTTSPSRKKQVIDLTWLTVLMLSLMSCAAAPYDLPLQVSVPKTVNVIDGDSNAVNVIVFQVKNKDAWATATEENLIESNAQQRASALGEDFLSQAKEAVVYTEPKAQKINLTIQPECAFVGIIGFFGSSIHKAILPVEQLEDQAFLFTKNTISKVKIEQ